jgi:hypothetical protein
VHGASPRSIQSISTAVERADHGLDGREDSPKLETLGRPSGRGVPLKAVQELLSHATMDSTLRYAHLAPDVRRDAVKLLDGPAQHRRNMNPMSRPSNCNY